MPPCEPMPPRPPPNWSGSSKPDPSRWASPRSWPSPKPCPVCLPAPGSPWSGTRASIARLRAHPELLPGAIEELLRYAGIVRRVFRRATANVDLGGVRIAEGELAVLMLASANRDPEQFPDPDRLDLTRPITSHVALGTGRNSCVGAMLIRMAASVATGALTATFAERTIHQCGRMAHRVRFLFPGIGVCDLTA